MACLTGQFDPKRGIELEVIVLPPACSAQGVEVPAAAVPRLALIDTGTTTTIIKYLSKSNLGTFQNRAKVVDSLPG
jgi:hypothetical protein